MKHCYRILTVGPSVCDMGPAMSLKMAKELLNFQTVLPVPDGFHRYIVIEEVPEK